MALNPVLDCIHRFPSTDSALPTQQQRMEGMQADRREMAAITAELWVRKSFESHVSRNADLVIKVGGLFRTFREANKRIV